MKQRLKIAVHFSFLILLLFLNSCATQPLNRVHNFSDIKNSTQDFQWQKIADGIWTSAIYYKDYPLIVHCVKIDLTNPGLGIITTDSNRFTKNGEVIRETTLDFAKRNNTTVAVNGAFFKTKSIMFSKTARPIGVHICNGKLLSKPMPDYGAVFFLTDNSAVITDTQKQSDIPTDAVFAVSGYKMILKNNNPVTTNIHPVNDSRTCIGTDKNGSTLFLLFVEAENKHKSYGITYDDATFFMQKLGVANAIHLDGGGSSSLIIKTENNFTTKVPSIGFWGLRKVATNLGFIVEESSQH